MAGREQAPDDVIKRARRYATEAHSRINHRRKYSLEPYDVHLKDVAEIVASAGGDPAPAAASSVGRTSIRCTGSATRRAPGTPSCQRSTSGTREAGCISSIRRRQNFWSGASSYSAR